MNEFNSDSVISTLRLLVRILKDQGIEYRFLGSVVIAAINGKWNLLGYPKEQLQQVLNLQKPIQSVTKN